jgi:hypothetical protein
MRICDCIGSDSGHTAFWLSCAIHCTIRESLAEGLQLLGRLHEFHILALLSITPLFFKLQARVFCVPQECRLASVATQEQSQSKGNESFLHYVWKANEGKLGLFAKAGNRS